MPKESSNCICLSVILISSVFRMSKNYYTQAFFEECKYIFKEKERTRHLTEDLEISSDSDETDDKQFFFNNQSKNVIQA